MSRYERHAWKLLVVLLLSGCFGPWQGPVPPPVPATLQIVPVSTPPPVAPTSTPAPVTRTPYGWTDELSIMGGICFEAANDAAGQVFVIRDAEEHIRFYGLADQSDLCRRPVTRIPFDFGGGRVLVGRWDAGMGCKARHDVLEVARDDAARTLVIRLRFVTEGDCPYELVRPFWIGLDGVTDYDISIEVEAIHASG